MNPSPQTDPKQIVRRYVEQVLGNNDLEAAAELIALDFVLFPVPSSSRLKPGDCP